MGIARLILVALGVLLGLALTLAGPAAADTIKVTSKFDSGPGTLRDAIAAAGPGDKVKVPKGRYQLTSGALQVATDLKVQGASGLKTKITAGGASRVFEVAPGLSTVTLTKLRVTGGFITGNGGGIFAASPLKLKRVEVVGNSVDVDNNWYGGGVYAEEPLRVDRSLIADNLAYNGGGLYANGDLLLTSSTLSANTAGSPDKNGDGGAAQANGETSFVDSTIIGNRCFNGAGCGGGFYLNDAEIRGSILHGNRAFMDNGLPAGSPGNEGVADNCAGTLISAGRNLTDAVDCITLSGKDLVNANAKLKTLKDNGGGTRSYEPKRKSPAVDHGARKCSKKDQRGLKRPQGKKCDIGAVERKAKKKKKKRR